MSTANEDLPSARLELRNALLAACIVMFADGFYATMSFPFASFMVENLRGTKEHLGLSTGIFFTAFPIGSLISAKVWAAQANYRGRRVVLLGSLTQCTLVTFAIAVCSRYEVIVLLRLVQGLLSCHLPMVRTCLRERVNQLKGDDVRAFSTLQAAFAASVVVGPALGGLLYGSLADQGYILPQGAPFILATSLYVVSLGLSYKFVVETMDLNVSSSVRLQQSRSVSLFSDVSIYYFLSMVTGHSFVFTGWEVGYPLLARTLESWSAPMIGKTFLIGGLGLLMHTLYSYPRLVRKMGLYRMWSRSWIFTIMSICMLPRLLSILFALGFESHSWTVAGVNYVCQLFISVLQGCNFTTLQLMMNGLIAGKSKSEFLLPIANAWIVSLQGLARAISPSMTGTFVKYQTAYQGNLAFDTLGGFAALSCLVPGVLLQKTAYGSEMEAPQPDAEEFVEYESLSDGGTKAQPKSSTRLGYVLTIALVVVGSTVLVVTGIASKSVALSPYEGNFVRFFVASIHMAILCGLTVAKLLQDRATVLTAC